MAETDPPAVSTQWITDRASELLPKLWATVCPLCRYEDDNLYLTGTGTLFQVADRRFLVTAAHVFKVFQERESSIYTCDSCQDAKIIPLGSKTNFTDENDLAVVEVADETISALPNRQYLRVHDADRFFRPEHDGWLVIHGYPYDWTRSDLDDRSICFKPYTRLVKYFDGLTNCFSNFNSSWHIALNHADSQSLAPSKLEAGRPMKLQGISGSSVWQIYRTGADPSGWNVDNVRVVGVETGVYRNGKVVKATRWGGVEYILRKAYPDLARPLGIVIPEKAPPDGNVEGLEKFTI